MTVSLYVGNLSYATDQAGLTALFSPFGDVISANVVSDRETGRSRGFGFVEMEAAPAKAAISSLDGAEHEGRRIRVNEALQREDRPRRY